MMTETEANDEAARLEGISKASLYAERVNAAMIAYTFKIFDRHMVGETILEMGPAEGVMTDLLASCGKTITLVEGSQTFSESLRQRFPDSTVINCLFEDFDPIEKFDNIILGHVLEHVIDPSEMLSRARTWLSPGIGRLFAAVPNARSLHRQAGVIMGLLPKEEALSELDIHHGHRRVFNPESFRNAFVDAGLRIEVFGGYWMKPVTIKQITEHWTDEMLEAFMVLGERYPDIAGEIYVVASNSD